MDSIQKPQALTKILVAIINVILFVVYHLILSFTFGFISGIIIVVMGRHVSDVFDTAPYLENLLNAASLIIVILLTIFLRKKIYF